MYQGQMLIMELLGDLLVFLLAVKYRIIDRSWFNWWHNHKDPIEIMNGPLSIVCFVAIEYVVIVINAVFLALQASESSTSSVRSSLPRSPVSVSEGQRLPGLSSKRDTGLQTSRLVRRRRSTQNGVQETTTAGAGTGSSSSATSTDASEPPVFSSAGRSGRDDIQGPAMPDFDILRRQLESAEARTREAEEQLTKQKQRMTVFQDAYGHDMDIIGVSAPRVFRVAQIRPATSLESLPETSATTAKVVAVDGRTLKIQRLQSGHLSYFRVHATVDGDTSSDRFPRLVLPLVNAGIRGRRRPCIIADGQSGTGKSRTMFLGDSCLAVLLLYHAHVAMLEANGGSVPRQRLVVTLVEVTNAGAGKQQTVDLLNKVPSCAAYQLHPCSDRPYHWSVSQATKDQPPSLSDWQALVQNAMKHRTLRATQRNPSGSSRGHTFMSVIVESGTGPVYPVGGSCWLIDLGGSELGAERLEDANAQFLRETRAEFTLCKVNIEQGRLYRPSQGSEFSQMLMRALGNTADRDLLVAHLIHLNEVEPSYAAIVDILGRPANSPGKVKDTPPNSPLPRGGSDGGRSVA